MSKIKGQFIKEQTIKEEALKKETPAGLSAATAFLIVAIVFGLLFTFITPPFQVPDEIVHFYRAYAITEGNILMEKRGETIGAVLPNSLPKIVSVADGLAFHPEVKQNLDVLKMAFQVPLNKKEATFISVQGSENYAPPPYLPQILGIGLGKLFNLNPLLTFYLARLFSLAAWICMTWWAIRLMPWGKWFLFVLAVMPMTLFEAMGVSADAMTMGLSFLLTALVFRIFQEAGDMLERVHIRQPMLAMEVTKSQWFLLIGFAIVLPLCKNAYILLLGLYALIPLRFWLHKPELQRHQEMKNAQGLKKKGSHKHIKLARISANPERKKMFWKTSFGVLGCWLLAVIVLLTWSRAVATLSGETRIEGVDATYQLLWMLIHPVTAGGIVARSMKNQFFLHLEEIVGVLGWLDTRLPAWIYTLIPGLLLLTALLDAPTHRWPARLWLGLLFAGSSVAIFVSLYAIWSPVSYPAVLGVQGRYFIPFMPMLAGFFGVSPLFRFWQTKKGSDKLLGRLNRFVLPASVPLMLVCLGFTVYTLLLRYYAL